MKRKLLYELFLTILVLATLVIRFAALSALQRIALALTACIGIFSVYRTQKGSTAKEENRLFHLFIASGMLFSLASRMQNGFSLELALPFILALFLLAESVLDK